MARLRLTEIASLVTAHGLPVIEIEPRTEDADAAIYLTDKVYIQCISSSEFCLVQEFGDESDPEKMEWLSSPTVGLMKVIELAIAALAPAPPQTSPQMKTERGH